MDRKDILHLTSEKKKTSVSVVTLHSNGPIENQDKSKEIKDIHFLLLKYFTSKMYLLPVFPHDVVTVFLQLLLNLLSLA